MAVQLNGTKGCERGRRRCEMARARISLPVPLSPVIRDVDIGPGDPLCEGHQLAHVAGDDGAVTIDRQILDRPECRALLTLHAWRVRGPEQKQAVA